MALTRHYFTKFEEGNYYHVYNISVDKKPLFTQKRNYYFFLGRMIKYVIPYVDVYAFCLLENHFHILVKIKESLKKEKDDLGTLKELPNLELPKLQLSKVELPKVELPNLEMPKIALPNLDLGTIELPNLEMATLTMPKVKLPNGIASAAFKKMFQSYALAFNKQDNRTGTLFQEPFKRSLLDSHDALIKMIYFIHFNPQKHGLISDFRNYPYSSYLYYIHKKPVNWLHENLYNLFGGYDAFIEFHNEHHREPNKVYSIENE